jgi:hypothetical protein
MDKRFKILFEKKRQWSRDEIVPFIRDVCSNDLTEINNSLAKHCRQFVQNGSKYFTSRI